ncbi:MAG: TlpA disulfide reductase family protein [Actinomycetota bacterium]
MRRMLFVVGGVALAAFAAVAALQQPSLPEFTPAGQAQPLPAEGEFVGFDRAEFEGVLVGQVGRPVVVNIWASWCGPCRAEMPLLDAAADAYGEDAVILGVAANDDPDSAAAFLDELDITYPNAFDTTGDIHDVLDVRAFPTTYVFGADGTLRARVNGGISEQRLAGLIDDALR